MEGQYFSCAMKKGSAILSILKAILILVILPFFLIWFVWNKTSWKKQNKWIATAAIAVVFLIILFGGAGAEKAEKEKATQAEIENLKAQVEKLEAGNQKEEELKAPEQKVKEKLFVENVIDGDTVKLSDGQVVRYIGLDAPETKECFAAEATKENEELVLGKEIKLEKDVSETDKYNRPLRYIYADDIFVNDYLVRNGLAKAANFPPDEKYKKQFKEAEEEAKKNKRGLWADGVCSTEKEDVSTNVSTSVPTPASLPARQVPSSTSVPAQTTPKYTCNCKKTCPNMSSCAEAQYQLNVCGCSARDADHDGTACDADCQ